VNTWTPPGTPTLSEIPDDETPQIRIAAITSEVPCYDPELGKDTMEKDYDFTDSMDYSDLNFSILMATMQPYSDSIVIPINIAGHELLALVDTGATHNFINYTSHCYSAGPSSYFSRE
jgi:hypothetical protein